MENWFPKVYNSAMKPLEKIRVSQLREAIIGKAHGRVLEIGSGTGANFPFYRNVMRVDAIEPNPQMSRQSTPQISKSHVPIEIHTAKAEDLPFKDNFFDSVVATLVFCTIPDPEKALQEIRRVSKPGAVVLFLEHVRMPQSTLGKAQDIITPLWRKAFDGCHLNRDTLGLISQSPLSITKVDSYYKGFLLSIECVNDK
ncbi:class I SAM-dependent methyltransferase [Planococcus shenhongbingii]|uniref:class I SAM-dependent methyltransferase n=1 Tax=Planococcus shenhongbingii TaxID=3058398 RepID=UPI002627EB8C|nr:class I SAM-dependent methyltransferase [Planococcus sp. N016]WKA57275.1 class I SAM-dependent methyltransferase [Planococcus sp. N016]